MSFSNTPPVVGCKLWIDGVGCHLLTFTNVVTVGNQIPSQETDKISIIADIATHHVQFEFRDETHWMTPLRDCQIDEQTVETNHSLCDGVKITLGNAVRLRLSIPSPLSQSAALTMESDHRFTDGIDGVVLFQKTCVLGASNQTHIRCVGWKEDVVLFARQNELFCKANDDMLVDGKPCGRLSSLHDGVHIAGEDWSMRVEAVLSQN